MRTRRLRTAADRALTVGAFLGVVAVLAALAGLALGVRPLFFRSGSMAPTIGTGSMALAREVPAGDLNVGDIVSVTTSGGVRVTHRVVAVSPGPPGAVLTLRGDANRVADPERYAVDSAYRVFWHVPWAGYVAGRLRSPAVMVMLGLLLASTSLRGSRRRPRTGGRRALRRPREGVGRHASRAGAAAVVTAAAMAGPAGPASAVPWTDPVTVGGTTLVAGALVAPVTTCSGGGLLSSPTIAWPTPSGPTPASYLVTYSDGIWTQTASVAGNSWKLPGSLLSVLAVYTITVHSVLGGWSSPESNQQQVSITSVLGLGLVAGCL
ncbi:MAG TPA: hypothetical protein VHO29_03925 [Marmoricola sp.]|nr:hypothetical protein [Marmoricola sp.]